MCGCVGVCMCAGMHVHVKVGNNYFYYSSVFLSLIS